jgi:uncharacterized membrane protein YfhO
LIIAPSLLLSFRAADQASGVAALAQALKGDNATANAVATAMVKDRTSLEQADAIRTFVFILIAFGILWAFIKRKINVTVLSVAFLALILVDMWQVDKRYLKDESFAPKDDNTQPKPREVDTFIQRDPDPDFRVLDLTQSITYDLVSPFFHKSVGGYSAARLKRIEELFDSQFSKSLNQDVLDMLNTKYIISADQKTQAVNMQRNPTACGNAWFVKSVKYAKNADEEMQAITAFAPKEAAIVDQRFRSLIDEKTVGFDPNATVKLTHYSPDHMVYQSGSTTSSIAVFSEIYYDKGWKMYVDGKEQPFFRADYILRATQLPVGNHKVEFIFHPASYYTGEKISLAGSILLVLALGGVVYSETKKKKP